MKNNIYIIAEAGVNHNGSIEKAKKLIHKAKDAGADCIKFQFYKSENLVIENLSKANYQIKNTKSKENQFKMLKKYELVGEDFILLKNECDKLNIDFLLSTFDDQSFIYAANVLKLKTLKISSGEITNAPLLLAHALKNTNIILSTGMSSIIEIEKALGVLAYGYICSYRNLRNIKPSLKNFKKSYCSALGKKILKKKITLLHCTSEYPAPITELNLNNLTTLHRVFNLDIGYSDHSLGNQASIIAATLGAKIIEKHFTLNKRLPGPDHKASLNPSEFKNFVNELRNSEKMMGSFAKKASYSENKNKKLVRKLIVAKKNIFKGEKFTNNNISLKRSKSGTDPFKFWSLINTNSKKNYRKDDPIK